jgi:hypothetical protein
MTTDNLTRDVHVMHRDETTNPRNFPAEWIVQFADGTLEYFDTEGEACDRQRRHRQACGMDPMTGERKQDA